MNRKLMAYLYYQEYLLRNATLQEQIISKMDNVANFLASFDNNFFAK